MFPMFALSVAMQLDRLESMHIVRHDLLSNHITWKSQSYFGVLIWYPRWLVVLAFEDVLLGEGRGLLDRRLLDQVASGFFQVLKSLKRGIALQEFLGSR